MASEVVSEVQDKFHYVHSCDVDAFLQIKIVAPKRQYKAWTEEDMKNALLAVKGGMTLSKAQQEFKVPKQTLSDRINEKHKTTKVGRKFALVENEESFLIHYIKYMASIAHPLSVREIKDFAWNIVKQKKSNRFNPVTGPGHTWWEKFKKRHQAEITIRKPDKLDRCGSRIANVSVLKQHFNLLEKTLKDLDLLDKPGSIFNCDESGIQMDAKTGKVVVERNIKQAHSESEGGRQHITAHVAVSAAGLALPPFIIFGHSFPSGPYAKTGPDDALYSVSANGYLDSELFSKWIDKLFIPKTSHLPRPLLLILDGHGSYLDIDIIELLAENGIHLFCLPPHTTNILQPLDVAVFRRVKTYFSGITNKVKLASLGNKPVIVCKKNFTAIFKEAYEGALNLETIKHGFKKCGICPFNPDAIEENSSDISFSITSLTPSAAAASSSTSEVKEHNKNEDFLREVHKEQNELEVEEDETKRVQMKQKMPTRCEENDSEESEESDNEEVREALSTEEDNDSETDDFTCRRCKRTIAPKSKKGKTNEWIACDECEMWSHVICENASKEDQMLDTYICKTCQDFGTLEGKKNLENYQELLTDPQLKYSGLHQSSCPDLFATVNVYHDGKAMFMPVRTAYKSFTARWNWNEWIQLPIKYQDLPRNAQLGITIWDVYDCKKCMTVGGTTVSLFGKYGTLRQGIHDLRVWPGKIANGDDTTPGKVSKGTADEMSKLAKLSKKHHKGRIMKVDWLDRLTFREIEMVNESEKRNSHFFYLMIEFPRIIYNGVEYSIVYFEKDADEIEYVQVYPEIVTVPDPEISQENLVESKHHRLTRSIRSGTMSRELKPNASKRDHLTAIISYPPSANLTSEEKDLIWQFRFYLTSQKKALTKFMKCVNWNHSQETKQAIDILYKWDPIDAVDALELLTPQFTNRTVRQYAVSRLKQSSDEDLLLYLLQLVQALRYDIEHSEDKQMEQSLANTDMNTEKTEDELLEGDSTVEPLSNEHEDELSLEVMQDNVFQPINKNIVRKDEGADLASFLVVRACTNDKIANFFYWYLLVECKDERDKKVTDMYLNVMRRFSKALLNGNHDCRRRRSLLGREQKFLDKITELVKQIQQFSGNRKKKIEKLQQLLDTPEYVSFEPLPLPLDPDIRVKGIVPHKASIFKSALMPMKLTFRTIQNRDYVAIFKNGDDLRQDQLVLQIITLMDKLLMREKLDLKLTPYNVLATSISQGLVQFIDSQPVAQILRDETSIQNFFRLHSPMEGAPYGIQPETMDCYVKSCAGYCVITYILGVGDRHLDNLLLTKNGNLFHIDFGYILGRDPKPFPPPMKLSKEMVDGMGGTMSEYYQQFRKLCFTAFLHLRRYANLFLNLFSLMVDASVPDIALEPDKTVKKVLDKFRLDLSDEEAVQYLQGLIDESVSAVFPSLVENIHKFAQYWRR